MNRKHVRSDRPTVANSKKKSRKSINLGIKLDVLRRFDAGERAVDIARELNLPPTTVRTIRFNGEKIRECAQSVAPQAATKITRTRGGIMFTMERLLNAWIQDQNNHGVPISMMVIQEKAKSLYEDLKKDGENSLRETFGASRGWFERFKRRSSLHHFKVADEAAACMNVDTETDRNYAAVMKEIIEDGGYTPQQVFLGEKTGLYWKRLPAKTFIFTEIIAPGFKADKDRLTLLLCANASGDFKLKPLLVYHNETPRALRGYSKQHLPVVWQSDKKTRVTSEIFQEWFHLHFCPSVKEYCARNNLAHKAILIMDSAPGHPVNLEDLSEHVQVVFLPPNATSCLQDKDQGIVPLFKAYYLRHIFSQLLAETGDENKPSIREFWHGYNIMKAIDNIGESWQQVTRSDMNSVWQNIWPEYVTYFQGFGGTVPEIQRNIVGLAKEIGFNDVEELDVLELLESHEENLSDEDVMLLEQQAEEEAYDTALPPRILTSKRLSEAFHHLEVAMAIFREDDPNRERSSTVNKAITNSINCYKELYQQKKKKDAHLSFDRFYRSSRVKTESSEKSSSKVHQFSVATVSFSESDEERDNSVSLSE